MSEPRDRLGGPGPAALRYREVRSEITFAIRSDSRCRADLGGDFQPELDGAEPGAGTAAK